MTPLKLKHKCRSRRWIELFMGFIRNYGNEQHIFHFHVMSKHMVHTYVTSFNLEIVVSITILFVGQYIQQIPRMVRGFFCLFFLGFFFIHRFYTCHWGLLAWQLFGKYHEYLWVVNSSTPNTAYTRQWTGSASVQVMVCRLFGAKPLPEHVLHGLLSIGLMGTNFGETWIPITI